MKIGKSIFNGLCGIALGISLLNPLLAKSNTSIKKYAIIGALNTYREIPIEDSFDQGTKNAFLINIANVYDSLRKSGYDAKNISVMYYDSQIDSTEATDKEKINRMIKEKNLLPANNTTLDSLLTNITKKANENDKFTLNLMSHGSFNTKDSHLNFELDNTKLYASDLYEMTKDIKANEQLYVIEACNSKKFANRMFAKGAFSKKAQQKLNKYLIICSATKKSIISRKAQFSKYFFQASTNGQSDINQDKEITTTETFEYGEKKRLEMIKLHQQNGDIPKYANLNSYRGSIISLNDNEYILNKMKK